MALPISYNIRNLVVRWKVTLLAIIGVGLVVTVFVILLSMSSGFRLALRATGRTDNGIVVQRGSGSELSSWFTHEQANSITADPRIAHGSDGQPLVSPELVIVANMASCACTPSIGNSCCAITPSGDGPPGNSDSRDTRYPPSAASTSNDANTTRLPNARSSENRLANAGAALRPPTCRITRL